MIPRGFRRDRRDILKAGALLVGGGALGAIGAARARSAPAESHAPLIELGCSQVQFESGPAERQARENHRLLLDLDEDALRRLRAFQVDALPAAHHA